MYIYHYRKVQGEGEYIILSEYAYDVKEIEDNTRPEFRFVSSYHFEGDDDIDSLPLDRELQPV
jgi:hypothetical protein